MKEVDRQRAILQRLARMEPARLAGIPTGFTALDDTIGAGGLPRGHMVEIFGPAGCGKTTLLLQIAAHVQREALTAAWIDVDHTFDLTWAALRGVDTERMPLAQPQSAEEALEIARTLAASGAVDLLVVDSAAALVPKLEMSLGIGSAPGLHSRVMASGLRGLAQALTRSGTCVVFLNQMRNRVETGGETSAGGPPLKLHASVRIMLAPSGGSRLAIRTVKNKAASGAAGRELEWRRGAGFVESP
jgi:recombination protein RecA